MKIIRLTPTGRGAVTSFLLCGEAAEDIFLSHWHGKKPNKNPCWGRLQLTDIGLCEEAVMLRTNEGLEIHIHGGEQVAMAIEFLFQKHGVVSKTWQEHFAAGTSQRDLALRLLPFAPTERTVQILLDQYNGAFDGEVSATNLGRHLVEPFCVVLAGASNAGKSSLLNAILGFQRSLVHSVPGTTRDVVSGQTALDGFPVMFLDTAGLRETDNDLEQQGIDRSFRLLTDADLIIWVIDSTVEESQRPECPVGGNVIRCYNKVDVTDTPEISSECLPNVVSVSALTGEGVDALLNTVIHHLVPHPPKPGEAVQLHSRSSG